MINENSFINPEQNNKPEKPYTKESGQMELIEKFGMPKTSDFQSALRRGEFELAENWLNYIVDNKDHFPQYKDNWNNWLNDRRQEINFYKQLQAAGDLDKLNPRSKEEARLELETKFGFADTKGFREALAKNKIDKAEEWLEYIIANKFDFPQYLGDWDNWLKDRRRELKKAREEN